MTDPGFSQALARVVDRLMDRLFPPVSDNFKNPTIMTKILPTLFGMLVWNTGWVIYLVESSSGGSIDSPVFSSGGSKDSPVFSILEVHPIFIFAILSVYDSIFTALIVTSFERGRPLNFFFRGVIFPVVTIGILRYAFP